MTKQEFLAELKQGLSRLPRSDAEDHASFYAEMIDDRMEEGLSEEEAVAAVGTVSEIVAQIIAETPLTKLVKERVKPKRRLKAWETVLLAVGSPIWVSLAVALFAILLSLYISLWAIIVSLWAVFASFVASFAGGIAAGICFILRGQIASGLAMIGAGIVLAGLSVLVFFACRAATVGTVKLTKKIMIRVKRSFVKKEDM